MTRSKTNKFYEILSNFSHFFGKKSPKISKIRQNYCKNYQCIQKIIVFVFKLFLIDFQFLLIILFLFCSKLLFFTENLKLFFETLQIIPEILQNFIKFHKRSQNVIRNRKTIR